MEKAVGLTTVAAMVAEVATVAAVELHDATHFHQRLWAIVHRGAAPIVDALTQAKDVTNLQWCSEPSVLELRQLWGA